MRTHFAIVLATVSSFVFSGTAANAFGKKPSKEVVTENGKIRFHETVSPLHSKLLIEDFKFLRGLKLKDDDRDLKQVTGLSLIDTTSLQGWLEDRVQYVLGERFSMDDSTLSVLQENYLYPKPQHDERGKGNPVSSMANLGYAIYVAGKSMQSLLSVHLGSAGSVTVSSPRVGIVQIGPGLFESTYPNQSSVLASPSNRLFRLSVFFHEARHSDGNGSSLGFAHATCPDGHSYAGSAACDANSNGPYTVEALALQNFSRVCTTCTVAEKELLTTIVLDSYDRVLKTDPATGAPVQAWDPTPEGKR